MAWAAEHLSSESHLAKVSRSFDEAYKVMAECLEAFDEPPPAPSAGADDHNSISMAECLEAFDTLRAVRAHRP